MKAIKKILVPIDVADVASDALALAADLARRYDAALQIIYVDQPLTYALPEGYVLVSREDLAKLFASFERAVDDARRAALAAGAPRVEAAVLRGTPVAEIVEYAKQGGYDLIVIGSHGRKGLARAFLGSVAENVFALRRAPSSRSAVAPAADSRRVARHQQLRCALEEDNDGVHTCGPSEDIDVALKRLSVYQLRRLAVTDAPGVLAGIISLNDLALEAMRRRAPGRLERVATTLARISEHRGFKQIVAAQ